MAKLGNIDFQQWLDSRRAKASVGEEGGDLAYAYVSDRRTRAVFERLKPVEIAVEAVVRIFNQVGRNQLLGTCVKVGPRQFSRVDRLARECADTLGIAPPTVYITNSPVLNAGTYGTADDAFIIVHSALVDHVQDEELRSVLGHECGHIHNRHVVYLTALHFLTRTVGMIAGPFVLPAVTALRAWSRRAEITCDRASMLCVRDVRITTRAIAKLALGSQKLYEQLDLEVFLEQYEEGQQGVGKLSELFTSHPWIPKRVLAMQVFEKSKLYRTRAGLGDDGISMNEVDEQVHKIVKVM